MKKVMILLVLACLPAGFIFSQTDNEKKAAFQLSFIPPLSTQGTEAPIYTNAVSFNILAGVSRSVTTFSLSGLGMYVKQDLGGFHLAGLGTYAGGSGQGTMIAGLLNRTSDYSGFQLSGLVNKTHEMNGIQITGLANVATGTMNGFQLAGLVNVANDVNGFQIGGLMNKAKKVSGFQLAAILNIADESDYPIGLVNLIKNGEKSIGITYDEIGSTMVAFRSGGRILYGILGVGYNHKAKEEKYVAEGGFGAHIPISSRFRINNELRSQFLTDFSEDNQVDHNSFAIMPAFRFTPHLELFGGPSLNYMSTNNTDNLSMFPSHSLWKKHTDTKLKQLYLGFSVGIQYIF